MILFSCALHAESKPIIEHFSLKRLECRYPLYGNDHFTLIETGLGKESMMVGTAYTIGRFSPTLVINIGIAGSCSSDRPIGEWNLITHIIDFENGKKSSLTLPSAHTFSTATLHSLDKPLSKAPGKKQYLVEEISTTKMQLVDMEASGFYSSAKRLLPKECILVAKVVSDHLEGGIPSEQDVESWIKSGLPRLEVLLSH